MSPVLLIGLGALGMWAFKKWRGGCELTGPGSCTVAGTIDGPLPRGITMRKASSRPWKVIKHTDHRFEVLTPSADPRKPTAVLHFKRTASGNILLGRGRHASERAFRAAMAEYNVKLPPKALRS